MKFQMTNDRHFSKRGNSLVWVVGVVLVVIIGGSIWSSYSSNSTDSSSVDGKPVVARDSGITIPNLVLNDFDGQSVDLIADLAGRPAVINSWAAWCPFCVEELPALAQAQAEFGDTVTFVAIDRAESKAVAEEYVSDLSLGSEMVFLLDPSDDFYQAIGGFAMPETLFVRADGTVAFQKRGPMRLDEIRRRTQELLN